MRRFLFLTLMTGPGAFPPGDTPLALKIAGIENAYRASGRLFSGGQPEGDASFEALRALGVGTIISVDGAAPEVERARLFGIKYVHLPVGYDGFSAARAAQLVKAVRVASGPVFIHCHHGKHRGPAAVALCARAAEGWSTEEAKAWLAVAGTSADYRRLMADAVEGPVPTKETVDRVGDLPERAVVSDLVESMVAIDGTWERLKAIREAEWASPADRPDLDPAHETLQLVEHFREAGRLQQVDEPSMRDAFGSAERDSRRLQAALKAAEPAAAESAFGAIGRACAACHSAHRDR